MDRKPIDLDTCTVDELRDELARLTGWRNGDHWWPTGTGTPWPQDEPARRPVQIGKWARAVPTTEGYRFDDRSYGHPIPWTLDAIAALMPEGWTWHDIHQSDDPDALGWFVCAHNGPPDDPLQSKRGDYGRGQTRSAQAPTELEARARCVAKVLRHRLPPATD